MSEKCKHCGDRIFNDDGQSFGILLQDGSWCCYDDGCMAQQIENADKELAHLREQLTIKTLENIKGSSVLDDKNAELARLQRVEAAAQLVLTDGHEHFGPSNGWVNVRDHDETLDQLAAALRETESK